MSIAIGLLAGLGFIFIGTQFLTANMKQVAGPRFHRIVSSATGHPLKAILAGIGAGAIIQSTNAVTFIVISLVSAGAATVRSAMPIVTWSYAGSTLRLLLASIDMDSVILAGVGGLGIAYLLGYDREAKYRNLVAAVLGLVLLLYGVQMMVRVCEPLRESESLRAILAFADKFYLWGFIAGTALAAIIQGQTVSVIAVALVTGGVLALDQAILIVVGANLGSGLMTVAQGAGLGGTARQLNLYQLVLKLIGVAVMLPLLMIEHFLHVPLIQAGVVALTGDPGFQVTAVHWMFQIVSAVVASLLSAPLFALIERISPASLQESLAKPEFITSGKNVDMQAAALLVEQEQLRVLRRLPLFLRRFREDPDGIELTEEPAATKASRMVLRDSSLELLVTIQTFLKQQMETPAGPREMDSMLHLWTCNQLLTSLITTLPSLAERMDDLGGQEEVAAFLKRLAESTCALMETVSDELNDWGEESPDMLAVLTADRSSLMRKTRDDFIVRMPGLSVADLRILWGVTHQFEQSVWLLNRFATTFVGVILSPRHSSLS
ncbi:Na/Pi symporter [Aquabacter cavernae]|uniref:Na/Pi symporter n=1 Tax=Aquabacter cavernae TaxID=2496029 RepID=UPI000F8EF831|nr:Na/Pi symporter [Aquabacter cavernae]